MVVLESGLIKAEKNPAIHCVAWHHYMSSQSHLVTRQDIYWFGYLLHRYTCTGHLQSRDINLEISAGLDIYLLIRYLEVGNLITRYILARYTIQTRYGSPHRPDIPGCQGEEGTYDAMMPWYWSLIWDEGFFSRGESSRCPQWIFRGVCTNCPGKHRRCITSLMFWR